MHFETLKRQKKFITLLLLSLGSRSFSIFPHRQKMRMKVVS